VVDDGVHLFVENVLFFAVAQELLSHVHVNPLSGLLIDQQIGRLTDAIVGETE
jgi:hypothetical protein